MSSITSLRNRFQRRVCSESVFLKSGHTPSIADTGSKLSTQVAEGIIKALGYPLNAQSIDGQTAGKNFEMIARDFIESSITLLSHLRPAQWLYSVHDDISQFVQYEHLAALKRLVKDNKEALTALGDYVVNPDVVVARRALADQEINVRQAIVRPGGSPKTDSIEGRKSERGCFHPPCEYFM